MDNPLTGKNPAKSEVEVERLLDMPLFKRLKKLFDTNEKEIRRLAAVVDRINALEPKFQATMGDGELRNDGPVPNVSSRARPWMIFWRRPLPLPGKPPGGPWGNDIMMCS